MSLSTELARGAMKLSHPALPKKKCALEIEADRIEKVFGGVATEVLPPEDFLARVEAALGEDGSGLHRLGRRELMVVPYVIWGTNPRWRDNRWFVQDYLALVAKRWPAGVRRLWRHYLLNFDPDSWATQEFATWLAARRDKAPALLQQFAQGYHLLEVKRAAGSLAEAALGGRALADNFEQIGLGHDAFRTSALLVAILAAAGRQLASATSVDRATERLGQLIGGKPDSVIAQAQCSSAARDQALRSLVDGLVVWQQRHDPHDVNPELALAFLVALNGDPRFQQHRWNGRVSDRSRAAVERWLCRETIEAFFRVIDALRTDRPDMWQERRSFWLRYLPHVSGAWLVVGPDAAALPQRGKLKFGHFRQHSVQHDQCGLMLQIRNACIMEMNKNGSAIFWETGAKNLPSLYQETYDRRKYLDAVDERKVFRLMHVFGWQRKFANQIQQMTGIYVSS
jgi:hypothetical protein